MNSIFIAIAIILTIVGAMTFAVYHTECAEYVKVAEIGGCDRSVCKVRLADGSVTTEMLPLVGELVCKHTRWK